MTVKVPAGLQENCRRNSTRSKWLERLPGTVEMLIRKWGLTPGRSFDSEAALVLAATRSDGTKAVLKLGMPHMEGRDEVSGMLFWNGEPTARVLEADPAVNAMLLELCDPGTSLRDQPEPEQDVVIARLLRHLWRSPAPGHPFRPLSEMTRYWIDETLADAVRWPDPALVREGLRLLEELPRTAPADVLLATDLHAGNVLRAGLDRWVVIDPKPFVGDPAYDATQHLFNCPERMHSNPDETIRRLAGLLGVDHERVRLWMFARAAAEPRDDWADTNGLNLARRLQPTS